MRKSLAPGRLSMGGGQRSTGLSSRFSVQPVDFNRYSINTPGAGQRKQPTTTRFATRQTKEASGEQAEELIQFFQTHGAVFPYTLKLVRDGPTRNEFRMWFEFFVKMISSSYELPDLNNISEEVPAVLNCLNYPVPIKNSTMLGLNTPHQWPVFLTMLDWLRKLVLISQEDQPSGNKQQDYTFKYAFDAFQQKLKGNEDYSEILAVVRELIICSSSYDDLNKDINRAYEDIKDAEAKLESEEAAIFQVEKEIDDYKHEIEYLIGAENEMKLSSGSMGTKILATDGELLALEEKLSKLRAENESLNKQVAAQPMSAYEASELLQKRDQLREEHKEKRIRHERLQVAQAEANKTFTKLATEKTERYRMFCSELSQSARVFGAEVEYRNFECALFGKSGGADALRAVQLGGQVSDAFRILINKIRDNVQRRFNEANQQQLESQLKKLKNDNDMHAQKLQQDQQRNTIELNKCKMKLNEAINQLTQEEKECEAASKQVEEIVKQNSAISVRTDAQASTMRQIEEKFVELEGEELEVLNQFAEYMVEATAHFESLSKMNTDLTKQKDVLLDVIEKIVDQTKLLINSFPDAKEDSEDEIQACLDDLSL